MVSYLLAICLYPNLAWKTGAINYIYTNVSNLSDGACSKIDVITIATSAGVVNTVVLPCIYSILIA